MVNDGYCFVEMIQYKCGYHQCDTMLCEIRGWCYAITHYTAVPVIFSSMDPEADVLLL